MDQFWKGRLRITANVTDEGSRLGALFLRSFQEFVGCWRIVLCKMFELCRWLVDLTSFAICASSLIIHLVHLVPRSRRATIFLKKAGSRERTAFVLSSVQRTNKTLRVLWNCPDTLKLFYYYFFYRKDKAKLCFLQQEFLAWIWAKWTLVSAFMFFLLWTGAILISEL